VHALERVRRRLGLQILFDFHDAIDAISFAGESGFRALELNIGNVRFARQLSVARERRRIRSTAQDQGITLALHALDGPSLFIPSERVRRCAVKELSLVLDWAADIGAANVVMHLGFDMNFGVNGGNRYTHEEFGAYFKTALGEALGALKEHAHGRARLCIENVGGFRYAVALPVVERLLGGNLGLCLDVGHTNVTPAAKRRHELAFFRRHIRHIHHSHIHDNSGVRDEHLALGRGRIDFVPFFRLLLRTDALLVLEVRPKEAALESRDYFEAVVGPKL
jgi:sugar phosphate isomerase/epimerase